MQAARSLHEPLAFVLRHFSGTLCLAILNPQSIRSAFKSLYANIFGKMPASDALRYPSDTIRYPRICIQLPTTRTPERVRLLDAAKRTARVRRETLAKLTVRALVREVSRCAAQMSIADRIAAHNVADDEALALLTPEERTEYGL